MVGSIISLLYGGVISDVGVRFNAVTHDKNQI